ncbi:MAG TPA: molecular chaperone DjiA, partial [Devosia sp.]|nr:molecular chaperone DjiA [Devosia sp.]
MPSVWQRIADFVGSFNERTGLAGSLANVFDFDNWLPGGRDAAFTLALIALSAKMAVADGVVTASEWR